MSGAVSDIAFTGSVKQAQEQRGSRRGYANMERRGSWSSTVTSELVQFLSGLDSFYLGTATAKGQPYIQHRGGPRGFLRVLDERTLAFADFKGNAQYISVGNLDENEKAYIFAMDYPNRRRIKIWGTARYVEDDVELIGTLNSDSYGAQPQRAVIFSIEAWDSNCPQHITPRFTEEDIAPTIQNYERRIAELESEVQRLMGHADADSRA